MVLFYKLAFISQSTRIVARYIIPIVAPLVKAQLNHVLLRV
jgi:hypothetical protein